MSSDWFATEREPTATRSYTTCETTRPCPKLVSTSAAGTRLTAVEDLPGAKSLCGAQPEQPHDHVEREVEVEDEQRAQHAPSHARLERADVEEHRQDEHLGNHLRVVMLQATENGPRLLCGGGLVIANTLASARSTLPLA